MSEGLKEVAVGLIGPTGSAFAGVVMRHVHGTQTGTPFSLKRLLIDLPTVFGLAIIGKGAGSYFNLSEDAKWAIAALLGYFGPQAINFMFYRVRTRVAGKVIEQAEALAAEKPQ